MMKSEFIERTGCEPTEAEYREIEEEYMGCDIDKDEFCKTWKKQGGIQRLMRRRMRRIEELEAAALVAEKAYADMDARYCKQIEELRHKRHEEHGRLTQEIEVLKCNQEDLESQLQEAEARAEEAERKMAIVRAACAILAGKEAE